MKSVLYTCCLAVLAVGVGTLVGCSGSSVESQVATMNNSNLKRMCNLYSAYQKQNGYLGPKDLTALQEFVKQMTPRRLEMMQIKPEEFDKLTISERDGKPFKIRFALQSSPLSGPMPVVFEEVGVGGTREVGFTDNSVRDADEAKYKELWGQKSTAVAPADSGQTDSAAKGKG